MTEPLSILVVDAEGPVRETIRATLPGARYRVLEARTGEEALRRLVDQPVALILVDLVLPDIGGLELVELAHGRVRSADVPIVLVSSAVDRELLQRGYQAGASDYMLKPLIPEVLRAKVELFERLHRQAEQLAHQADKVREAARLEQRLANEHRYRHLADSLPSLIWTARTDGCVDYLNERWAHYTGEPGAPSWTVAVHPDDLDACTGAWRDALAAGAPFEGECRLRSAGGDYRWFLCQAVPERNAAGQIVAWLGTFTDIDQERRTREVLLELKGTVDSVVDAVLIFTSTDWRVLYANHGASALLGYTHDELFAMRPIDFLAQRDEAGLRDVLAPLVGGKKPSLTTETKFRRRDGSEVSVEVLLQLIRVDGGRIVAIARDITERLQARHERELLYREAVEALRARDEFLSIASHELRTPLSALQLQLEMLLHPPRRDPTAVPSPHELRNSLELATHQVDRLSRLIDELLDVTRITAGRLRLEREAADLAAIARGVVERFAVDAARARCAVVLDAPEPVVGQWDPLRLEQVVTNLLTNAFKFGAGKPIEITVGRVGPTARLTVTDHGIGIAADDLERIFLRFEQAVSQRTFGGLGLGLYIVRGIVEAHGGSVRVDSAPKVGSTLTIELPCRPEAARNIEEAHR